MFVCCYGPVEENGSDLLFGSEMDEADAAYYAKWFPSLIYFEVELYDTDLVHTPSLDDDNISCGTWNGREPIKISNDYDTVTCWLCKERWL